MNPGKKKNPFSSAKSWQFPKEKALDICLMRKKKNGEENSSTCFWKPGRCPGQIKPKAGHIQVTNSQHVFPQITWKKRQVLVKVLEALRDGQACYEVCRDWAKCLKMCNSTFHFRVWRLLPSWWLGGGEMGAGSTDEAEPLPGALSTCTAPTAGLPLRVPTLPPPSQRFPGSLEPSISPDQGSGLTSLLGPGWSTVAKSRRGWEGAGKKKQTF